MQNIKTITTTHANPNAILIFKGDWLGRIGVFLSVEDKDGCSQKVLF